MECCWETSFICLAISRPFNVLQPVVGRHRPARGQGTMAERNLAGERSSEAAGPHILTEDSVAAVRSSEDSLC
jgi:hypothetical protein